MLQNRGIELIEPRSNRPFSIHQPDSAWVVECGSLDLFLVDEVDGEFSGARHPMFRMERGSVIFGLAETAGDAVLAAVPTPETQLFHMPKNRLKSLLADTNAAGELLALLEEWVARLTACASLSQVPQLYEELIPGEVHETAEESRPIMPVKGVVWVEHQRGSSRFLDIAETEVINGAGYFPVSRRGWIQPASRSRVLAVSTTEWQKKDPEWSGLQTFHTVILRCLIQKRRQLEETGRSRRKSQAAIDSKIVDSALWTLASTLEEQERMVTPPEAENSDPTFLACAAIGESLGVKIVAPPEMRSQTVLPDALTRIAYGSGLRYRRVVLKGDWWKDSQGPLLAFRESDNRPVAILPTHRRRAENRLYDPVESQSTPVTSEVAMTLGAFAYTFYPPLPNRKLSLWDLGAFALRNTRQEVLWIIGMGVCGGMLAVVVPVAIGIIFDSIIPNAQRNQLLQIAGILVVLAIAAAMFTLSRNIATLRLEGKMDASLQAAIWDRLLRLPVPFFRQYTAGDLADRSLGIDNIVRTLAGSVISSVLSGVFSMFSFLLLFYYSWRLAMMATAMMIVSFGFSVTCMYKQIGHQREMFYTRGRISGMLLGFVENIARLRVAGAAARAFAAWAREFAKQKKQSFRAGTVSNSLAVFNSAFPVISLAVLFAFSIPLQAQPFLGGLTTGAFLAFLAAFIQFQAATLQLSTALESALSVVPMYERAVPILETLPEVSETTKNPGELHGSIEVSHVNFRYQPESPLVLRDVSLTVRQGEFVAIVGASGSGKSSLFRLLLGFEKAESGAIYYDTQDLSGLDVQAVRRQIGVVIQNARLISGTIFESIAGSAALSLEDAWEAARNAGLADDINAMPMGMHTVVSEGGGNLSVGQRQRLLIARAMVRKPRIFLFDEATSALDNRTQAIVSHSLEALQSTRVVIAHRMSTIVKANRIFVMNRGVLVDTGSYDELAGRAGVFRELAKRQVI